MPIDPNIPLQAGNLWNPAQNLSNNLAVAGQMQNYQAAKAAFEAKKQERLDNEKFKTVAAEANGDVPTMIQNARAAGLLNHADALEKHWLDTRESFAKLDDIQLKKESAKADRIAKKALWATTPERWASDPELASTPFDQRNALLFGSMTAQQVLDLQRKQDDEANSRKFEQDKFAETMRHNKAMESKPSASIQNVWSTPTAATDENGNPVLIQTDKTGNVRKVQGFAPKPSVAVGKPGKTDFGTALGILGEAEQLVKQAPGSYLGQAGLLANRVVGRSTESTQAQSQLEALQASLMMRMPRMEGPQSDKDVQLYREQAGRIADPSVPAGDKLAAIRSIKNILSKYQTAPQGQTSSPKGAASVDDLMKGLGL